ncbi:MAG: hypothetical protein WDN06_18605 [Asticcacaulis sp.]
MASLALIDGHGRDRIEGLFSGAGYGPGPLTAAERERLTGGRGARRRRGWRPACRNFVVARFQQQFRADWGAEATALMLPRAPIDLRVNGAKGDARGHAGGLARRGSAARSRHRFRPLVSDCRRNRRPIWSSSTPTATA